ncbi:MAG TPA: hypothetical protein VN622_16590 [Clostridia bacterium]|nr:hypothetical protein [Clostridia bacterium]
MKSATAENGTVWSRRKTAQCCGAVLLLAVGLCAALVLSRRPILAYSPGEWDCACGDMYIKTTRHVIWNPLRDRLPEAAAFEFLADLKTNHCSAGRVVCEGILPNHRVSAWKLAYREDRAEIVSLYFKLAKYGKDPRYNLTGVGVVDLRKGTDGWAVIGYDSYF